MIALYRTRNLQKCVYISKLMCSSYHLTSKLRANLKTPDLVYFPQVMRWLKTKIGFKVLKKAWDPDFSEGAFIYGTSRAICRVTEQLSIDDRNDELKNLVTPALRKKLIAEMKIHLTELQKKIIVITPKDIKLLIPLEVRLMHHEEKKTALVALRSLAVKWQDVNGGLRLAIIALQTEFIRDYTNCDRSEWTIRLFDILECGVVGEAKSASN